MADENRVPDRGDSPAAARVAPGTRIVPGGLIDAPGVSTFARRGHGAILFKRLQAPLYAASIFARAASLTIVTAGEKRVTTYDGGEFVIGENEAVFLPPDLYQVSDLLPEAGGTFEQFLFFFEDDIVREFLTGRRVGLAAREPETVFRCPYGKSLRIYAEHLGELFAELDGDPGPLLRIKLLEALQLLENADRTRTFADWLARAGAVQQRDLKSFMESNFHRGLTLEDYAALTGRSVSSFQRDFKRIFGMTPGQWITERRMRQARELFDRGATSVTDVAFDIGYENISHFIRTFRKVYGVSPGEYRERRGPVV